LRSAASSQRCYSDSVCGKAGLELKYDGDVAVVTMSNKDNRFNLQFLKEFNVILDNVEENKSCRGLMTTGSGKFYSNGIDLEWLSSASCEDLISFSHNLNAFLLRLVMFPLPTMAVMNGHAFAGGGMLSLAHDLRVMNSDKGWLCLNEVYLSIKFSETMMEYLKVKVGGGKNLADAIILGKRYTAAEALENRLTHAAFPQDSLSAESLKLLQAHLGKSGIPRTGVSIMKKHIYADAEAAFKAEVADNYETFSLQFMNETQRNNFKK